jgi:ssDNA-binding replication factor A large subunit
MDITKIKDLKDGDTGVNLMAPIDRKEEVRDVTTKFGDTKVCTVFLKDDSGEIKFTLWGKNVEKPVGEIIAIMDGTVTSFRDELQLNQGRKK